MSKHRLADYRLQAFLMVVVSAAVLLFLSALLQTVVWEAKSYYHRHGPALPEPAKTFFDMFGRRPDGYLIAVVLWLWWLMVAELIYCHFRHRSARAFALAFLFRFVGCWLLAALVLSFMALMCVYPVFGLLLADLGSPPGCMNAVPVISWMLPVLVVIFGIACWWRFRRRANRIAI